MTERETRDGGRSRPYNDCMKCAHHYITYDPAFPYGCRAMGFKSKRLPQYEVIGASQQPCQFFLRQPRQ